MSDIAIQAHNLSKSYRLGSGASYKALRDVLGGLFRPSRLVNPSGGKGGNNTLWALKDVSFELRRGDSVGIIGRNGAGKSTLLKIISRIAEPTAGRARVYGRVASLLEVGTGFHPELTGRDNIFLSGAIMGMRRREIISKFDAIVAFAEVEKFIDTSVKYYSSGMYVRLAFSVAAHLEPDILLVDEVLAVGDSAFQKKCLGKMGENIRDGRTVLLVSHNLGAISALSKTCIYINRGQVRHFGDTADVVRKYLTDTASQQDSVGGVEHYRRDRNNETPVRIRGLRCAAENNQTAIFEMGKPLTVFVELEAEQAISGANVTVALKDIHGQRVVTLFSWDNGFELNVQPGRHTVKLDIGSLPLPPGSYFCDAGLNQTTVTSAYDVILDFPIFEVVNQGQVPLWVDRPWGCIHWKEAEWKLQ